MVQLKHKARGWALLLLWGPMLWSLMLWGPLITGCASATVHGKKMLEIPVESRVEVTKSKGSLGVQQLELRSGELKALIQRPLLCQEQRIRTVSHQQIEDRSSTGVGGATLGGMVLMLVSAALLGGALQAEGPLDFSGDALELSTPAGQARLGGLGISTSVLWLGQTYKAYQDGRPRPLGESSQSEVRDTPGEPTPCGAEPGPEGTLQFSYSGKEPWLLTRPSGPSIAVSLVALEDALCSAEDKVGLPLEVLYSPLETTGLPPVVVTRWNVDDCILSRTVRKRLRQVESLELAPPTSSVARATTLAQSSALLTEARGTLARVNAEWPERVALEQRLTGLEQKTGEASRLEVKQALDRFEAARDSQDRVELEQTAVIVLQLGTHLHEQRAELWQTVFPPLARQAVLERQPMTLCHVLSADEASQTCFRSGRDCPSATAQDALRMSLQPVQTMLQHMLLADAETLDQHVTQVEQDPSEPAIRSLETLQLPHLEGLVACQESLFEQGAELQRLVQRVQTIPDIAARQRQLLEQRKQDELARAQAAALLPRLLETAAQLQKAQATLEQKKTEATLALLVKVLTPARALQEQCQALPVSEADFQTGCAALTERFSAAQTLRESEERRHAEARAAAERAAAIKRTAETWRAQFKTCRVLVTMQAAVDKMPASCTGPCRDALEKARSDYRRLVAFEVQDAVWDSETLSAVTTECRAAQCPRCP